MGKRGSKWLTLLLLELSLFKASSEIMPTSSSFYNNTIHDILLRDEINHSIARKQKRQRRRLHSRTSGSSRGSYTMDSESKRFHPNLESTTGRPTTNLESTTDMPTTNLESTTSMPTPTTPAGTLWRQSLLNKVFDHARDKPVLHSQTVLYSDTEVLNSEYHNSFDSFMILFNSVPLPGGPANDFGSRYSSSTSSRGSGKVKGGKGDEYYYYKGKSSSSKSSKKQSKRSIDSSFMNRQAPVQFYDLYPIRPVHFGFPASPPQSTPTFSASPLTPAPTSAPKFPTMAPTKLPSPIQDPSPSPVQNPTPSPIQNPSPTPIQEPSATPSVSMPSPMQPTQMPVSSTSTCQWTVCGDVMSNRCSGIFLEPPTNVRLGGEPEGRELAVRCCSDTELPNFRQFSGDASCPFAGTELNGQCYKEVDYQEAVRLCGSVGARLCTKDEMERRCTFGTGCDYNNLQIWTSTPGASGYFEDTENSFKIVTASQDDTEIQATYPCRGGLTGASSIGMLTFNEAECRSAECLFRIPYTQYRRYCTDNPDGAFAFTIPGPFTADFKLYIGNAAESWDLQCEQQLSVSFD
mmetsp:Transcript_35782/g.86552  ORF Transcript_35782/g.86552 Transcript_35782/m.86552 type:complete len:575 (+) Transcript_35782:52-1776(+)